jgi:hypothetical protein
LSAFRHYFQRSGWEMTFDLSLARRRVESDHVIDRTGITDQQWWQQIGPTFAHVFDATRFPLADRVGQAAGQEHQAAHDPEHAYRFGLDRLIDGVTALITRRCSAP